MSNNWINNALENRYIQLYSYSGFYSVNYSEEGTFSLVASGDWPRTGRKVALKKLKNFNANKFVSEVNMFVKHLNSSSKMSFINVYLMIKYHRGYLILFSKLDKNTFHVSFK